MKKLLVLGPLPNLKNPKSFGGATVSMQLFVDHLEKNDYDYGLIQTNKFHGFADQIKNHLYTVTTLFLKLKEYRIVMVNVSSRGAVYLWPFVYSIARIFRKKIVFRKFGGGIDLLLESIPSVPRKILLQSFKGSDLLLVQTKLNLRYLSSLGYKNTHWFPTVRTAKNHNNIERPFNRKFVFISHVREGKGVTEIVKAVKYLPKDYVFDLYGPVMDSCLTLSDFTSSKAKYIGVLKPIEVESVLRNYDVLVLPTKDIQEGYPGILIEALSLGIPVISTRLRSIPEIINDDNGFLVEPGDFKELSNVILKFNNDNISSYRRNAKESFASFNEYHVYSKLIELYNQLLS